MSESREIVFYDDKGKVKIMIWRERPQITKKMTVKSGGFVIRLEDDKENVIEKKLKVEDIARLVMLLKKEVIKDYEEMKEVMYALQQRIYGFGAGDTDDKSYM